MVSLCVLVLLLVVVVSFFVVGGQSVMVKRDIKRSYLEHLTRIKTRTRSTCPKCGRLKRAFTFYYGQMVCVVCANKAFSRRDSEVGEET